MLVSRNIAEWLRMLGFNHSTEYCYVDCVCRCSSLPVNDAYAYNDIRGLCNQDFNDMDADEAYDLIRKHCVFALSVIDAWLWLYRNRQLFISLTVYAGVDADVFRVKPVMCNGSSFPLDYEDIKDSDPEKALYKTMEWMADNKFIFGNLKKDEQ